MNINIRIRQRRNEFKRIYTFCTSLKLLLPHRAAIPKSDSGEGLADLSYFEMHAVHLNLGDIHRPSGAVPFLGWELSLFARKRTNEKLHDHPFYFLKHCKKCHLMNYLGYALWDTLFLTFIFDYVSLLLPRVLEDVTDIHLRKLVVQTGHEAIWSSPDPF